MYQNAIKAHLQIAQKLNLLKIQGKKILDIGTGFGYFPYICNIFGHSCYGLDIHNDLYDLSIDALDVNRFVHRIEAFKNLPDFGIKFDMVISTAICFNNHGDKDSLWGAEQWRFFLNDLAENHMSEKGEIFLRFNFEKDGTFGKSEIPELMTSFGAIVSNAEVYFPKIECLRNVHSYKT